MFTRVLRVSVAVHDLDAAVASYEALGLVPVAEVKESPRGFGLRWVELGEPGGGCLVELLTPTREDSPVARFLACHGEGVYQVRLGTQSLAEALDVLVKRGVRVIRDTGRPTGARPLGWIHPRSTHGVLMELVQESGEEGQ